MQSIAWGKQGGLLLAVLGLGVGVMDPPVDVNGADWTAPEVEVTPGGE